MKRSTETIIIIILAILAVVVIDLAITLATMIWGTFAR